MKVKNLIDILSDLQLDKELSIENKCIEHVSIFLEDEDTKRVVIKVKNYFLPFDLDNNSFYVKEIIDKLKCFDENSYVSIMIDNNALDVSTIIEENKYRYNLKTIVTLPSLNYIEDSNVVSDGYHTFGELYDFRTVLNAGLFNEWFLNNKYDCHKSKKHNNGSIPFNDNNYFIVSAKLPDGIISFHYELKFWDLFKIPEVEKALFEYDDHTSYDVLNRIMNIL